MSLHTLNTARMIGAAAAVSVAGSTFAASINHGDFAGTTVDYLDVTEDDIDPSYGAPVIGGDTLFFPDLSTSGFIAEVTDTVVGTISMTVASNDGTNLSEIWIEEGGDYQFTGLSGAEGVLTASLSVLVFDTTTNNQIAMGTADFSTGVLTAPADNTAVEFWDLDLHLDVSGLNTDEVFIVINNNLSAVGTDPSTGFIQKKYFDVTTTVVPEPGSIALLGLGGLLMTRRRRSA